MTNCKIALVTGTCIAALATPAKLAATTTPGLSSFVSNPAVTDVVIVTTFGNSAEFGVVEAGNFSVKSLVDLVANGTIEQTGIASAVTPGTADIEILNQGTATIVSSASSTNALPTDAKAEMQIAVTQYSEASQVADLHLFNVGDWTVVSSAEAVSLVGATADSSLAIGFKQFAGNSPLARLDFQNTGARLCGHPNRAV